MKLKLVFPLIFIFSFPTGRDIVDVKQGFYRKCRIPNTVGAVDGTLIPIIAPTDNEAVYVCRKNFHAINVQAVVDHRARQANFSYIYSYIHNTIIHLLFITPNKLILMLI